jgi:hypothetical protein
VTVNVPEHEATLEAELSREVLYEQRSDRDEDEVALDEVDRKLLAFRELAQLVGVVDEPARRHQAAWRWESSRSGSTLSRMRHVGSVGPSPPVPSASGVSAFELPRRARNMRAWSSPARRLTR